MLKRDRQHYLSQAYLRNFSCDLNDYLENKGVLSRRNKVKRKEKMRIHFFDVEKRRFGCRKIQKIAIEDFYFPKPIDREIQAIELKLPLLWKIFDSTDNLVLEDDNNREVLLEIANCFWSRSRTLRDMIKNIQLEDIRSERLRQNPQFMGYVKKNPDLIQSLYLSKEPEKILQETWPDYKQQYHIQEKPMTPKKKKLGNFALAQLKKIRMIPSTYSPILLENKTFFPFITGDDCVVVNNISELTHLPTGFYFPISPVFAIQFVEESIDVKYEIFDSYEVYRLNHLIYECSRFYLFANTENALRLSIIP